MKIIWELHACRGREAVSLERWVKVSLSIRQRLRELKTAIEWLSLVYIPTYNHDESWIEYFPFRERFACFLSALETAIVGYVYSIKEEERGDKG